LAQSYDDMSTVIEIGQFSPGSSSLIFIVIDLEGTEEEEQFPDQSDSPYLDNFPWLANELSLTNCTGLSIKRIHQIYFLSLHGYQVS